MKQEIRAKILEIFRQQSGYARTRDIRERGIHNIYLKEMEEEGAIVKIKHGLYSLPDEDSYSSIHEALLGVPGGVICMGTALSHYELTTWNPADVHVAIRHGRKIVLPDYPPVQLFSFSGKFFDTGRTTVTLDSGQSVMMYDMEKTICDLVRYRNRIGIDIMKEALTEYTRRKEKDLNLLYAYARSLDINSVLEKYMEVLL